MTMQLIIPNDAEQAIIDELATYEVGTSLPETIPPLFVRVLAVGGTQRDLVTDTPTMTLEVFATLESTASETANLLIALLQLAARNGAIGSIPCYGLQVVSLPQNYPLPSVPTHKRYITTIAPALRRAVVTL
ncbi:tail terminator [Microbacterium phage Franklin22]|uniref:tail terminator n=1 Tax=Microbacterium phage Franklin22 TaxID=2894293 RepID=UPI001E796BFA|nr:tail terminator [Microbacterium phage Franklin22]UGL61823.1 tail terminator [Microbacterium phage Franklin22]